MNIETYRLRQELFKETAQKYRQVCDTCLQPCVLCYCRNIKKFDPKIKFVVLIHPIEARRKIATGRMSHLCMANSQIIRGHDYSNNKEVNSLLANPNLHPVILYPGPSSINLSDLRESEKRIEICPREKTLTIFVLDGTWATAKKMIKHSQNLISLPRICFTPKSPSNFRIRKQPDEHCYSTIEAIHQTIELLGESVGFDTSTRSHDRMLDVFNSMVELHLDFINKTKTRVGPSRYRSGTG